MWIAPDKENRYCFLVCLISPPFGEKFSSSPGMGEGTMKSDQGKEKEKSIPNFTFSSGEAESENPKVCAKIRKVFLLLQ